MLIAYIIGFTVIMMGLNWGRSSFRNPLRSFGNFIGDSLGRVWNAAKDAANNVAGAVGGALKIINNFDPLNDLFPGSWKIPGTNIRIDISQLLLGALIGQPLLGLTVALFYRRPGGSTTTFIENPYTADLKVFINGGYEKTIFVTPHGFSNTGAVLRYMQENAQVSFSEICVYEKNSQITLTFNDVSFDNNDGSINVAICYMGQDENSCTCPVSTFDNYSLAVGYCKTDPNRKYPVECHGMVYVGDKNAGLSTGGRCEIKSIDVAETTIYAKYADKYTINFNDLEPKSDLQKSRVLDLVYKYNGISWIRQQNLIESVYYHTGIGNDQHALFFGGIHDTIAPYTFSYAPDFSNLETPTINQFDFSNQIITEIIENKKYGMIFPETFENTFCWEDPKWTNVANYNKTPTSVLSNPLYTTSTSGNYFQFINDEDFPKFKFSNIAPNGNFDFGLSTKLYSQVIGTK